MENIQVKTYNKYVNKYINIIKPIKYNMAIKNLLYLVSSWY